MVNCAIFGCSSNNKKSRDKLNGIGFFRFPKNNELRSVWIVKYARTD